MRRQQPSVSHLFLKPCVHFYVHLVRDYGLDTQKELWLYPYQQNIAMRSADILAQSLSFMYIHQQ